MTPSQTDVNWQEKLTSEVARLRAENHRELTLNRLKDKVRPPSEFALLSAVAELIADGSLSVFYRVKSPKGRASIGRFPSLSDVPDELFDETTGEVIFPDKFNNVEAVYVAPAHAA